MPSTQSSRYRGAWTPGTAYLANDLVSQDGILYAANVDFTSGAVFGAANWTLAGVDPAGLVMLTPTSSARNVITPSATTVALVLKGAAAQSANLQEWQDSTGTAVAVVSSAGRVGIGTAVPVNYLDIQASSGAGVIASVLNAGVGRSEFYLNGSGSTSWRLQNTGSPSWQFQLQDGQNNATKMLMSRGGSGMVALQPNSGNVGIGNSGPAARLHVTGETTTLPVLIAKGAASQTADLAQLQDSTAAVSFAFTAGGRPKWSAAALVQTTVGAAGGASALPATPTKYLQVVDNVGTTLVIPAYAAS